MVPFEHQLALNALKWGMVRPDYHHLALQPFLQVHLGDQPPLDIDVQRLWLRVSERNTKHSNENRLSKNATIYAKGTSGRLWQYMTITITVTCV